MNYLNDDILDNILKIRTNDLEYELYLLNMFINKLDNLIKPLSIIKEEEEKYNIKYDIVYYLSNSFLYNIPIKGNVIIIYPGYIYNHDPNYLSNLLINPTFFTLLLEANKAVIMENLDIYNNMITFEDISIFNHSKCELFNIKYNNNIKYIELKFGIYNNIN